MKILFAADGSKSTKKALAFLVTHEAPVGASAHMIVMGTHGHGILGRALPGSVAQHVVTEAAIPVLLVQ